MGERRFEGKAVFITGAASGIGQATARLFAGEGAKLFLVDMDKAGGEALAKELGAKFFAANVAVRTEVEAAVASAIAAYDHIDVLFNNAGIGAFGSVTEVQPEDWDRVIAVDLTAIYYACRAAIPHMRAGGAIINTASISGLGGDHRHSAYNAAKGGVVNLTRSLAVDFARKGLRVNAISPGVTVTPMTAGLEANPDRKAAWLSAIPMARTAKPEEMASVVAFLASEAASYVTGVIIPVDGGVMASNGSPRHAEL